MKTKLFGAFVALLVFSASAAIIFFTDKPNATPVGSDFFALQRNRDYINSSFNQVSNVLFFSSTFTGTPTALGNFVVNGIYYGNGLGITNVNASGTNASFTYITNNTLYSTNIQVQNITNNTFITTNVTVNFPGGITNLNLTPNSVMRSDNNDAEASVPNAVGVLTNNGVGGIGFASKIIFTEIDVLNAYLTNIFTFITNAQYLMTDGNGKVINGTGLPATNILFSPGANITFTTNGAGSIAIAGSATNIVQVTTNNTFVNTNIMILQSNATFTVKRGATVVFETNAFLIDSNITANSAVIADAVQNLTNAANAHGVFTNSATGPPLFGLLQNTELVNSSITIQGSAVALGGSTLAAGSSPFFNLVNSTNLIYRYTTNAMTGITLTFGQAFFTNVSTANITVTAINAQDLAAYETCVMWCTNSSGTSWTVTLPNGIGSPGLGLPPVITVTNKQSCQIYIEHYGNQATNAWFKAIY